MKKLVFDLDEFMDQLGSFLNPLQLLTPTIEPKEESTTEKERKEMEDEARREEEAIKEKLDL